ncbi:MAG: TlpA disulfide reductase family protein [Corynebacterium sp.]|nr:TlpA disulfide reductase family protein [Corynebacterium sp.]
MKKSTAALLIAAALGAGLGLSACSKSSSDSSNSSTTFNFYAPGGQTLIQYSADERKPVQEFSGDALMDSGKTINLSDYDGQVVVLNAWGQWCAPCRTEADDMETIYEAIKDKGGTVLGINVRDYSEDVARDFVKDSGLTYPSIYDPPFKTAAALGGIPASVVPTTIVLDKQHRPAAVFLREVTSDEVLNIVNPLLSE